MTRYASIISGIVREIVEPFFKTEEMRPPMPEDLAEDATQDQKDAHSAALALHDDFVIGEVPIAERFHPDFVATLVALDEGAAVSQGDSYADGVFGPPPAAPSMTEAQANSMKDGLLAFATTRIAPLQDAVDLGEATPADEAALLAWKQYRVKVNRVNQQPGYPANIAWPEVPQ